MASVASKVMSTVSAPYGVLLTPAQLADKIADVDFHPELSRLGA
jgi:hypothetical protein